jgi:hypothetical protein
MCKTPNCTAKSYNSKRTLYFKNGSIFAHHVQTSMDLIVCVILCFVLMLPPSTAALIVGFGISKDTIGHIYTHIRLACQHYNNKRHRRPLGGCVQPGDPLFKHAVQWEGKHRLVVEYDESKLVCVCVCACVCATYSSPYAARHYHTHTHTHTRAVCLKRNRWAKRKALARHVANGGSNRAIWQFSHLEQWAIGAIDRSTDKVILDMLPDGGRRHINSVTGVCVCVCEPYAWT